MTFFGLRDGTRIRWIKRIERIFYGYRFAIRGSRSLGTDLFGLLIFLVLLVFLVWRIEHGLDGLNGFTQIFYGYRFAIRGFLGRYNNLKQLEPSKGTKPFEGFFQKQLLC